MRRRDYLGQLELMVLLAVIQCDDKAYGVPISRELERKSGREISLSSVYAALSRLEAKGFVSSFLGEPTAERGGKARAYFRATAEGKREARDSLRTFEKLSIGLITGARA